MKGPWVIFQVK